jgi:hypothetical protein
MPLSELHVLHVCSIATDQQCKYLHEDELDRNTFQCLKLSSQKKYAEESCILVVQKNKDNENFANLTKNDNCAGYPILRYKMVGYDQKNS